MSDAFVTEVDGPIRYAGPRNVGRVPLAYNHKNTGRPPDPDNTYRSPGSSASTGRMTVRPSGPSTMCRPAL